MILLTIIVFILILGALIIVHEFSHFIFARKTGMRGRGVWDRLSAQNNRMF